MKDQSISVVVPTYNRPESLRKALLSALNQQEVNITEILVINDSTDESPVQTVLQEMGDSRIKYFRNERKKGGNGARNTGIINAKGEFIAFLDDDDEWFPEKLSHQLTYLLENPERNGVFSGYKIKLKKKWKIRTFRVSSLRIEDVILNRVSIGSSSNLLFRSKIFDEVGLWDEDMFRQQDLELLVRILSHKEIGYDHHIVMKVHGRHNPEPRKAYLGQEIYFEKMRSYFQLLSETDKKIFYSNHLRRLSMFCIQLGEINKAFKLYQEAMGYRLISPNKDFKNLYFLLTGFFFGKRAGTMCF